VTVLTSSNAIRTKHQNVTFAPSFKWNKKELLDVEYYEEETPRNGSIKET